MGKAPINGIHWLPEEEYQKAVSTFRLQVGAALYPLRLYGQGPFVDQAILEITKLTEDFGLRVRGVDHPLSLTMVRRSNGSRDYISD